MGNIIKPKFFIYENVSAKPNGYRIFIEDIVSKVMV